MTLLVSPKVLFKDAHCCITYEASSNLLCITSQGYQQVEHIKLAFTTVLTAIREKKATKLLVDNTGVRGTFTDATEWVTTQFIPQAIAAGIIALASIPSKDVFGKFAGSQTLNRIQGVILQRFTERAAVLEWLKSV